MAESTCGRVLGKKQRHAKDISARWARNMSMYRRRGGIVSCELRKTTAGRRLRQLRGQERLAAEEWWRQRESQRSVTERWRSTGEQCFADGSATKCRRARGEQ